MEKSCASIPKASRSSMNYCDDVDVGSRSSTRSIYRGSMAKTCGYGR